MNKEEHPDEESKSMEQVWAKTIKELRDVITGDYTCPAYEQEKEKASIPSKKMRFRFHKGTLEESLKTVTEVSSLEELKKIISEYHTFTEDIPDVESLRFDKHVFDSRIGWNTYYVVVKLSNIKEEFVAGMSNSNSFAG